jgi:hypothetical protein
MPCEAEGQLRAHKGDFIRGIGASVFYVYT